METGIVVVETETAIATETETAIATETEIVNVTGTGNAAAAVVAAATARVATEMEAGGKEKIGGVRGTGETKGVGRGGTEEMIALLSLNHQSVERAGGTTKSRKSTYQ